MPTSRDFKRLVRARMKKTGEAYTAARAQIISRDPRPVSERLRAELSAPPPAETPAKPDYAALAGISDEKLTEATACNWERWVHALDRKKAYELPHRELAALIREKYKTPAWWTQAVAVGYERINGLRVKGQHSDGSYSATKSRTFPVSAGTLFDAWADARTRRKWLDGSRVHIRTSSRPKSMRLEIDGALTVVGFTPKARGKSSVAIEQDGLPSRDAADSVKRFWTERFDRLAGVLG